MGKRKEKTARAVKQDKRKGQMEIKNIIEQIDWSN